MNERPLKVYNKELELVKELPSKKGLNIYDKSTFILIKYISYNEPNLIPRVYSDDQYLYTGDTLAYVDIYEKNEFKVIKTLTEAHDAIAINALKHNFANAIFSDDYYVYVGTEWWKIRVYDRITWEQVKVLKNEKFLYTFTISNNYLVEIWS